MCVCACVCVCVCVSVRVRVRVGVCVGVGGCVEKQLLRTETEMSVTKFELTQEREQSILLEQALRCVCVGACACPPVRSSVCVRVLVRVYVFAHSLILYRPNFAFFVNLLPRSVLHVSCYMTATHNGQLVEERSLSPNPQHTHTRKQFIAYKPHQITHPLLPHSPEIATQQRTAAICCCAQQPTDGAARREGEPPQVPRHGAQRQGDEPSRYVLCVSFALEGCAFA